MNIREAHTLSQIQKRYQVQSGQAETTTPAETASISDEAQKANLIESMIRHVPNPEASEKLVASLSVLPLEALGRIAAYGTKLEVYDKNASDLPLYARHLQKPNLAGAYSPAANVLFVDQDNITPRIMAHEAMHALDMSLGQPSSEKPWTVARDVARSTRKAIRPYATHNSAEYFADNLAASLFDRDTMDSLVRKDWLTGVGVAGLERPQLEGTHQYYHREGQAEVDPLGAKLCEKFWQVLPRYGSVAAKPALTPNQYRAHLVALHAARKRQA